MRTQRYQKPNVSKPADRKITAKKPGLWAFAKRAGLLTAGLLLMGGIAHGQKNATPPKQLPADPKHKLEIAAADSKLPANVYVAPTRDGKDSAERVMDVRAAKKIEPGPKKPKVNRDGYEIVDKMIPSSVTPDAGKTTLTMKIYTFRDVDGNIIRGNAVPVQIWISKEQLTDLGATGFDGEEIPIILKKSNGGYSYFFVHKNWKGLLQIDEPMFKDRECGVIPSNVMSPNSQIYKPLIFWNDSSSLLVATERGVFGLINGYDGEMDMTDKMGVQAVKNPQFLKDESTEPKVLVLIVSNSKRCIEFILNKDKQMTGDMRVAELE